MIPFHLFSNPRVWCTYTSVFAPNFHSSRRFLIGLFSPSIHAPIHSIPDPCLIFSSHIQGRVQISNELKQHKLGEEPQRGSEQIRIVHKVCVGDFNLSFHYSYSCFIIFRVKSSQSTFSFLFSFSSLGCPEAWSFIGIHTSFSSTNISDGWG